jgi:PAS domain S-box-containing protein
VALNSSRHLDELRDAHQRLSFHVNRMPLAYIVWDADFKVAEWNPTAERTFGWKAEEALGQDPYELIVPREEQSHVGMVWSKLLAGDESSYSLNANTRKDGKKITCEWFNTPLRDAGGKIVGVLSMVHDVTEKTQLERQLQTAQRMEAVGTLAGGIAHDFNNALTGIFGFGEMLRAQLAGNERAVSNLNEVLRCAERASTLTRQLLTYSRRQIIEPVNLGLNTVITELLKLVSKVVGEHIELRTSLAKNLPTVRADLGQIEQVVMNLVLNARDAMPGGGQLVIETGLASLDAEYVRYHPYMSVGSYVVLTISDTGIGMDQKTQERVFEPFFTTKGPDRGTGLGLAMVYGIIKQHNGFIHLYSEPGKGTTFKIYLPPVEAAPDVIVSSKPSEIHGGKETVLLAEDDESVRMFAEWTLTELGYTVLAARNGEDALEVFNRNKEKISLALLDVVMPVKGGKESYEVMHKIQPGLKVIFMSGYTANAVHESFVLIAGVPFLEKPFGPAALARKVREVLDEA